MIDWSGPCYVIGGGKSRDCHDLRELPGRVIAINRALEDWHHGKLQKPDMWVFADQSLWDWVQDGSLPDLRDAMQRFDGLKVTINWVEGCTDDIIQLEYTRKPLLAESLDKVPVGNNTGFFAINLAYLSGCDPIVLVGFDCEHRGKHGSEPAEWYHDGYPRFVNATIHEKYERHFEVLADELEGKRTVWNASPKTELTCWPILSSLPELSETNTNATGPSISHGSHQA